MNSGLDALRERPEMVRGRRVGVVTNHTGIAADFRPTAEVLADLGARVVALFGPEHGYDGIMQDALPIGHATREVRGAGPVPIYSLYQSDGDFGIPAGALDGIDLLVFDMQDVGARYYTYPSTLGVVMEAVVASGIPVLVLDRPNPLGGTVEGPGLDPDCRSFVGWWPVPVRHGLTLGELARYANATRLGGRVALDVVPATGWRRDMLFPATGLTWVAPSPNIPAFDTALVYPGTCLLEGTNMAEGRGTTRPFELVGAPWIDGEAFAAYLNDLDLPGARFRATRFLPAYDRHAGQVCGGVQIHVTDAAALRPVTLGLHIVVAARRLYPEAFAWREPGRPGGLYHFDRLIGSRAVRPAIDAGATVADLTAGWGDTERAFAQARAPWLLYP
jgi:uncharacterized protein YbbC (DUF1343 family)